jgi:REP-associated tyrosine transposase
MAAGCLMLSVVGVTLRTNANIAFLCVYHVVWCPKFRRGVIGGHMAARLKEVIAEVIAEKGAWLIELETMADHVHLLGVDPQLGIHRSRVLGREFGWLRSGLPTVWTDSYFGGHRRWGAVVGDHGLCR